MLGVVAGMGLAIGGVVM
nr:hypothetical protein [Clostridium rectalis]